jgi:hypothetical protein
MTDLVILVAGVAAGYALAIYTWAPVRTFVVGVEQELAWAKERARALEARLRAALRRDA